MPAVARSLRPEIRNPVLRLPAAQKLAALDPAARAALREVLEELRRDAHAHAEHSWLKRKAASAAYWRAVGVYAGHLSRALRDPSRRSGSEKARARGGGDCTRHGQ